MQSCTKILKVNTSSKALKKFISQLSTPFKDKNDQEKVIKTVLDSLIEIVSEEKRYEVFAFSRKSGIKLLLIDSLSKEGFCFCTSIYLEHLPTTPMTIFRLAYKEAWVELIVKDRRLVYRVSLLRQVNR